jgi:hypothetical protein
MRSLIWKEVREHAKWLPVPGLVILLVFLIDKPDEPLFDTTDAYFLCVIAAVFGAALGFGQIFFEGHGDKRSFLLHRPLYPSYLFLAKTLAGIGLYLLALGIPFVWLELWLATPGNMPAPFQWRTSLPWLADILTGLVYYFAGMLVAQREARWLGSRCLPLASAFFCSYLVWALTEFWQALATITVFTAVLSLAAWGSFRSGGAADPQPRPGRVSLAATLLLGLLMVSLFVKQLLGIGFSSEVIHLCDLTRDGRMLVAAFRENVGKIGPWLDARTGEEAAELNENVAESSLMATWADMETPLYDGYRNGGRFFVVCVNDSQPGVERWFYDPEQHRLLGYHKAYHHFLGSFGPSGFTPAGEPAGEPFQGNLLHRRSRFNANEQDLLAFPRGVYQVDYARRKIDLLFAPAAGETVAFAGWWQQDHKRFAVISTDRAFHIVSPTATRLATLPRSPGTREEGYLAGVGLLTTPEHYFVWYRMLPFEPSLGPAEYRSKMLHLYEYDLMGQEVARFDYQAPTAAAAPAKALFGFITPITEAATLASLPEYLRKEVRLAGRTHKPVLLDYLASIRHYMPGTSRYEQSSTGVIAGYIALMLVTAFTSGLACFLTARRFAFAPGRCAGWTVAGILFGWVGVGWMFALADLPVRVTCSQCRKLRVVTRNLCEHCGAPHTTPARDGTEVFGSPAMPNLPLTTCRGGL